MVKVIHFGKIDGYHNGRKSCAVEIEFGFREFTGQKPYFTAVGNVWNSIHSDIIFGGQCLDELIEYKSLKHNELFISIYNMWKEYHLKSIDQIPVEIVDKINYILTDAN